MRPLPEDPRPRREPVAPGAFSHARPGHRPAGPARGVRRGRGRAGPLRGRQRALVGTRERVAGDAAAGHDGAGAPRVAGPPGRDHLARCHPLADALRQQAYFLHDHKNILIKTNNKVLFISQTM